MRNRIVNAKLIYGFSMVNTRVCQSGIVRRTPENAILQSPGVVCGENRQTYATLSNLGLASRFLKFGRGWIQICGYHWRHDDVSDLVGCLSTGYRQLICPPIDSQDGYLRLAS